MIRGFKNWFSNLSPMQVFWFHVAFILFLLTTAIHNPTKKYSRDKLYIFPYSIPHPPSPHIRSYFYAYETDTQNGIRYLENSDNREAIIASGISAENIGRKMREDMNNFIKILHSNRDKEKEWVLAMERNGWTYENYALRRPKRWFFDPRGWNSNGSIKVSWMPDLTNLSSYLVGIATIFSLTGFLGWLAGIRANGIRAQRGNGGNTSAELSSFPSHCPPPSNEIAAPDIQAPSDQERASFSTEAPADVRTPAPRSSPGLPGTPTKAGSSFGGKMLSLFGKMLSLLITGIIVLVLGRSIGGYIGKQAAERDLAKRTITQTDQPPAQGMLVDFHVVGLTIKLPGKPNERTIPMPDAIKATLNLKSKHSYLYQNGTQTISISRDVFDGEFDFASGCDIIFEKYKSIDSAANQIQYSVDGISGRCFKFDAGNETYCELLVFNRGNTMWQVQVLDVTSRSDSTKALIETIFSSIRISK